MKINIGTQNKVKVESILENEKIFDWFVIDEYEALDVPSMVEDQPLTAASTLLGAKNRARLAFRKTDCDIAIGIEEGMIPTPGVNKFWQNYSVTVIYDGENYFYGVGGGFLYPPFVVERVLNFGEELSDAYKSLGLTKEEKIGTGGGIVGDLSDGTILRKDVIKTIVRYALLNYHNKELYIDLEEENLSD